MKCSICERQGIKCVNSLDISPWSPPPASRKLRGDSLYVRVLTLENVTLHLTACSRGFYVNWYAHWPPETRTTRWSRPHLTTLLTPQPKHS